MNNAIERLYSAHAHIYDLTRPFFLFGRKKLIDMLPLDSTKPLFIREVGCGTGFNLERLAKKLSRHPTSWEIEGADLSTAMLKKARKKAQQNGNIRLVHMDILEAPSPAPADLVLLSYVWSMMPNPNESAKRIRDLIKPGGFLAVVDFYGSKSRLLHEWMRHFHVSVDPERFRPLLDPLDLVRLEVRSAFAGLWTYCLAIARRPEKWV